VPFDVLVILGTVFVTFSLQFFASTAWLPELLRLTPAVWQRGFVWQLVTYPLVGTGAPGIWFLLELLILFWFARDVHRRLGSRSFRRLLAWATITASVTAVLVQLAAQLVPGAAGPLPFVLLQGQRLIVVVVIAAFATLFGQATIYLFFVLPVQAKWFLWLEVLFAFMGFLGTRDLAGFVGVCAAIAVTYNLLTRGALRRGARELWLRMEQKRIQRKMARMRRQSGIRLVEDDEAGKTTRGPDDPWVH
jgi:hypothetical protein